MRGLLFGQHPGPKRTAMPRPGSREGASSSGRTSSGAAVDRPLIGAGVGGDRGTDTPAPARAQVHAGNSRTPSAAPGCKTRSQRAPRPRIRSTLTREQRLAALRDLDARIQAAEEAENGLASSCSSPGVRPPPRKARPSVDGGTGTSDGRCDTGATAGTRRIEGIPV